METATATLVPATLVGFIERRRVGSVPPRGMVFVERRRPAPVHLVDVEDLHDADLQGVLADRLDYGFGAGDDAPVGAATLLAGLIASTGPVAVAAHAVRPAAAELAG